MQRRVSVEVDADLSPFNRSVMGGVATWKGFVHELESADGRMANLVQTGLALAPAIVPLGATGIPIMAGLAAQVGAAAAAGGVAILAFQGVGDALKALNDYQIDPTEEHFKKLQQTMDALGPAGELFVRTLQEMRPELQDLQDVAQQGMFPGLTDSLIELEKLKPEAEQIIGTISRTLGELSAEGAGNLNDQRWVDFIHFLDREAAPTLKAMGKTLGYVVEGAASMMMAFDPLADSFTQGMVGYARSFRDWADGLDQTEGFQQFVDYINDNGPEAMETLAALGNALVALVTAAAPVGSAVLPVIQVLADTLAAIADSPVGPILIGTASAVGLLGRSLAILKAVGLGNGDSLFGRIFQTDKIRASALALTEVTSAQDRARLSASELIAVERRRQATIRAGLAQVGKNAALLGGLALATSGIAEKSGLANTATYALMGTIAGPWGAAIGGAIGAVQDFRHADDQLVDSLDRVDDALKRGFDALPQAEAQLAAVRKQIDGLVAQSSDPSVGGALDRAFSVTYWKEVGQHFGDFSHLYQDEIDQMNAKTTELFNIKLALWNIGMAIGDVKVQMDRWTDADFAAVVARAQPAMDALGISVEDLQKAAADGSIEQLAVRIADYVRWSDSAAGRTQRVADAMAGLDDQMVSTKDSATDLKTALDALLDPNLNLSRATDAWTTALRHLEDDLDKNNTTLKGNSDAAIKNREAINQRVDSLKELLGAEADAGASSRQLANDLKQQRRNLIEAGVAAGIARDDMRDYLRELGLTPKLVETMIEARTDPAKAALREIKDMLDHVPRSISTTWYVNQVNAANLRGAGGRDGDPSTPYWSGGYTGPGGKYERAGTVHRREVVIPSELVARDAAFLKERYGDLPGMSRLPGVAGTAPWRPPAAERYRSQHVNLPRQVAAAAAGPAVPTLLEISGVLQTPFGPSQVEGTARAVVREEMAAEARFHKRVLRGG